MQAARGYWWWLGAAVVSDLGSNVMAFAVTWTASGFGGTAAGLIASTIVVFRIVLLMLGGSIGDRVGPRAVMIGCDTLMLIIATGYAVWFFASPPTVATMLSLGCVLGIVSAFYVPASGVFPRLFVDRGSLPKVMATTSSGLQLSRLSGPAVGGLLIASVGLAWMTVINAATFLVVLIALLLVTPPRPATRPGAPHVTLRQGWSDIRAAGQHQLIFGLLAGLTVRADPDELTRRILLRVRDTVGRNPVIRSSGSRPTDCATSPQRRSRTIAHWPPRTSAMCQWIPPRCRPGARPKLFSGMSNSRVLPRQAAKSRLSTDRSVGIRWPATTFRRSSGRRR